MYKYTVAVQRPSKKNIAKNSSSPLFAMFKRYVITSGQGPAFYTPRAHDKKYPEHLVAVSVATMISEYKISIVYT